MRRARGSLVALLLLMVVAATAILGNQAAAACARARTDGLEVVSGHWRSRPLRLRMATMEDDNTSIRSRSSKGMGGVLTKGVLPAGKPELSVSALRRGVAGSGVHPHAHGRGLEG
jgi:hypothetical protein